MGLVSGRQTIEVKRKSIKSALIMGEECGINRISTNKSTHKKCKDAQKKQITNANTADGNMNL
jgi:hypothetical protein